MNAPDLHRTILKRHIATVEAALPIRILGILPRGAAEHVFDPNALDLLAEKRAGLDLFGLAEAEIELGALLGRPVGIVLVSGLHGRQALDFPKNLEPL
jgi:predicted nucleotidyltransferase